MKGGIDYDHKQNLHTVTGARATLEELFQAKLPASFLDVGCGTGAWVRAARDLGVTDVIGIDGIAIRESDILFPHKFFRQQDLREPWDLGRRFDVVTCLEVAEHLPSGMADGLIASIANHSDQVIFSAAVPGQLGQHHVNCQWPAYWQSLFNAHGYVCEDTARWKIWNNARIEPWYRQNLFVAKYSPERAGKEERIPPVIHPDMLKRQGFEVFEIERRALLSRLESGSWPTSWYVRVALKIPILKLRQKARKALSFRIKN